LALDGQVEERKKSLDMQQVSRSVIFSTNVTKILTHCGRVTQICVFNTMKLGTSTSSP